MSRLKIKAKETLTADNSMAWLPTNVRISMTDTDKELTLSELSGRRCVVFCNLYFVKITDNGKTKAHWSVNIKMIRAMDAIEPWLENSEVRGKAPDGVEELLAQSRSKESCETFFISKPLFKKPLITVEADEGIATSPPKKKKTQHKNKHSDESSASKKSLKRNKITY